MSRKRQDHEAPQAENKWGWRYHHLGIPTTGPIQNEKYLPQFKFYVGGFDSSPFGIEWMRFDVDSPIHELIKTVPHLAFEVDDLDEELRKHNLQILTPPNSPGEGTRVAMIVHNGAPVELIEFEKKRKNKIL
ncbi:MAG TPA: hypothetical protein PLP19_01045 [bacterium]|nr:hypothetical protein [bacterium]HPN42049.1 hypothetical protein [bacterium]